LSNQEDVSSATEMLYSERKDFIIIGLTGRTGSGCSTVAKLLNMSFANFAPPKPKENDFKNNEERKYQTLYRYARSNWEYFTIIEVKNIILSFLLENDFKTFMSFIETIIIEDQHLLQIVKTELDENIKIKFNDLHTKRVHIKSRVEGDERALKEEDIYKYYFIDLPAFINDFEETLKKHGDIYTRLFQAFGNNIRISGSPYDSQFKPKNIFRLSQRINKLIKILRRRNLEKKGRVLAVIDAFRNPYEATFFKDRYSSFYLFSVNTEDETRIKRLIEKGLDIEEIKRLDEQEYPLKQLGKDKFVSQNIQKCIELADVHLNNPTFGNSNHSFLKKLLIKYISLIMHPGLVTPTHEERCMQIAFNAKLNSGCLSRQVGAVVCDADYSIKSVGWNNTAEGQVPCNLRNLSSLLRKDDQQAFSFFEFNDEEYYKYILKFKEKINDEKNLNGRCFAYCFKDTYNSFEKKKNQVHTRSLHAEENAFLQIAKYGGVSLKNGYLFTTASPCELCSKKAYQIGMKKIYYIDPYPGISNDHILKCGKNIPEMRLFYGAIGSAYYQLYMPIIPYKDELYMLLDIDLTKFT